MRKPESRPNADNIKFMNFDLSGKRILVTGGGGFLGSHIVERLRRSGCGEIMAPRRKRIRSDAGGRDRAAVPGIPAGGGDSRGCHGGRDRGQSRQPGLFFYENAIMGIQMIEACRRHGVEKTVVLGTICAYPKHTPVPFREEALWDGYPEETNAPYGVAKKALLVQCQAYREQYGMNAVFLLPVNLYGPRDNFDLHSSHVIPALIRKCVEARDRGDREITLWGDGSPTREFLYVEDAAEAVVLATERYDGAMPVNIGSGQEIAIRDLAGKVARDVRVRGPDRMGREQTQRTAAPVPGREPGGVRIRIPRAKTGLDEGLRATVEWYRRSVGRSTE